jgi:hypothetical protein
VLWGSGTAYLDGKLLVLDWNSIFTPLTLTLLKDNLALLIIDEIASAMSSLTS